MLSITFLDAVSSIIASVCTWTSCDLALRLKVLSWYFMVLSWYFHVTFHGTFHYLDCAHVSQMRTYHTFLLHTRLSLFQQALTFSLTNIYL